MESQPPKPPEPCETSSPSAKIPPPTPSSNPPESPPNREGWTELDLAIEEILKEEARWSQPIKYQAPEEERMWRLDGETQPDSPYLD